MAHAWCQRRGLRLLACGGEADLTGLGVIHHGGEGGAAPPPGLGKAAVSYGIPNRYQHPVEAFLDAHKEAGWTVEATAARKLQARGDRWLT